MDRANPPQPNEPSPAPADPKSADRARETEKQADGDPNPPRTTTDRITDPKLGASGSGGAEREPGSPRP